MYILNKSRAHTWCHCICKSTLAVTIISKKTKWEKNITAIQQLSYNHSINHKKHISKQFKYIFCRDFW